MKLTLCVFLTLLAWCHAWKDRFEPDKDEDDVVNGTNFTRRWDNPPPGTPSDALWHGAVCKGRNFYNAFFQSNQQAGQMFNPPLAQAATYWERTHMTGWGYRINYPIVPAARNLGPAGFPPSSYGIARALESLLISSKDRVDGGRLMINDVYHWDPDAANRNPPVLLDQQTYNYPRESRPPRRYTGMLSTWGYSPVDGVIINTNIKSTTTAAHERTPPVPDGDLPRLRALSDLQWIMWNSAAQSDQERRNLRWYFIASIRNDDTRKIIRGALIMEAGFNGQEPPLKLWPGQWIDITSDAGLALLGSPLGRILGYFLVQHKPWLGNMWADGVVVFHGDTYHGAACLAFRVREPAPRPPLPNEPGYQHPPAPNLGRRAFGESHMAGFPKDSNVSEILRQREETQSSDEAWVFDENGKRVV